MTMTTSDLHFDWSGYLKPAEGDSRIAEIEGMLDEDLSRLAAAGR
jgi:hypothetical protein